MPFDPDSGQVFRERLVKSRRHDHVFKSMHTTLGGKPRYIPPEVGACSLVDIATRKLLCNLQSLTLDTLDVLPAIVVERLWKAIQRSNLDSVALWRLFAQTDTLGRSFVRTWSHRNLCGEDFSRILDLTGSDRLHWLTNLSIVNSLCSPTDLISIAQVKNLRNLCIDTCANAKTSLSDRITRAWAYAAKEQHGFPRLEMLFLDSDAHLSRTALTHLADLPALDTCIILPKGQPKKLKNKATNTGWLEGSSQYQEYLNPQAAGKVGSSAFRWGPSAGWPSFVQGYITHRRGLKSLEEDNKPVLNVLVGSHWKRRDDQIPFEAIVCLERDWTFRPAERPRRDEPAAKKRKLKDGKAATLQEMLDNL